jgi:hypothetical protein
MAGADITMEWCRDTVIDGMSALLWLKEMCKTKLSGCQVPEKKEEIPSIFSWIGKET